MSRFGAIIAAPWLILFSLIGYAIFLFVNVSVAVFVGGFVGGFVTGVVEALSERF